MASAPTITLADAPTAETYHATVARMLHPRFDGLRAAIQRADVEQLDGRQTRAMLREALQFAEADYAGDSRIIHAIYKVGDEDPTPHVAEPHCGATKRDWTCTWEPGHTHPQHIAGTGEIVGAVWPV